MVSMTVTKGVISTNPLGVAGRATCRPFGDGLVSTHPIPFGNISLTAKTERNTSPFHGLHDGDKGGGFNPHPFARQAEPWLLAVSRVFMMTTKGVVLRDPLCRGQAEPPVEPFGDGVISTDPIPPATSVLPPRLNENETFAVSRVSMMTLVRTAFLTCASQAPLRSTHFVTMLHVTCYNKVVPYCAGWAYRKYIVYIIYILYILYIFYTPPKNSGFRKKVRTYGRCLL